MVTNGYNVLRQEVGVGLRQEAMVCQGMVLWRMRRERV